MKNPCVFVFRIFSLYYTLNEMTVCKDCLLAAVSFDQFHEKASLSHLQL